MINKDSQLTIHKNSSSIWTNDFRDAFSLTLADSDYLYLGYYKPFNSAYIALNTPNENSNNITGEYWNGSSWTSLDNWKDDSKGFTRSGFINWSRNQTDESSTTVNGVEAYWIRLSTDTTHSSTEFAGIGFLFADDKDLQTEVPEITDTQHLAGKTSHLLTHAAVRNQIVQELNNRGLGKVDQDTGITEDLTCWDILEATQIKQAAIFLTLSKIYFNFSDSKDDKFYQKYQDYQSKYKEAFSVSRLSLDSDDDGKLDSEEQEKSGFSQIRIKR